MGNLWQVNTTFSGSLEEGKRLLRMSEEHLSAERREVMATRQLYNTLQNSYNTLQNNYNTLQNQQAIAEEEYTANLHQVSCNTLQPTATHCNPLQPTATHCNPLQPTATQLQQVLCRWVAPALSCDTAVMTVHELVNYKL